MARPRYRNRRRYRRRLTRRRPVRRTIRRRPRRSRRAVLNIASRKKRDTMQTVHWKAADPGFSRTPLVLNNQSADTQVYIWCATAREMRADPNVTTSNRSSSEPYYRGLQENLTVKMFGDLPWVWRRIVFSNGSVKSGVDRNFLLRWQADVGYERVYYNLMENTDPNNVRAYLLQNLFKGAMTYDWADMMLAPTNSTKSKIISDRTMRLFSGNSHGSVYMKKYWYPMNKTMIYEDIEAGQEKQSYPWASSTSTSALEDVYVVDLFKPLASESSAEAAQIEINSTATLYWHER